MATGNDGRTKVLILDSDRERAANLCCRLRFLDYETLDGRSTAEVVNFEGIAVIVGDTADDEEFAAAADKIRKEQPGLPFLCLSEINLDSGPNWPLELPLKRSQLERLLNRARRYQGTERRHRITGSSRPIRAVREMIEQVSDFDTSVLVTGQSGTGKELVARTIHDLSDRAQKPFVPINCGAIPAELLESELFGHDKGAFTGAITSRQGRFELAEGGTLFLDEIGEMSLDMQVKLLRVLQERTYERVGSNKLRKCNVRIIAATHVDIPMAISNGEFREDLYYRLNVFPIEMPPLYKRVSDLPQLLDELLVAGSGAKKSNLRVSADAIRVMANYRWPGNIRELSNLVERLAILKPEGLIEVDDLPEKYKNSDPVSGQEANEVCNALRMTEVNLKTHLRELERDMISQAMQATGGIVAKAARLLKMRRTTLVEKIGKYQIN